MRIMTAVVLLLTVFAGSCTDAPTQSPTAASAHSCGADIANLCAVRPPQCSDSCYEMDAVVFVHGIYGSADTFYNSQTHFYWPAGIPTTIDGHPVDVYSLNYQTQLLTWASQKNPQFDQLAQFVFDGLRPLRVKRYRSIGFIAHSLGGNVVSTYLVKVTDRFGHPPRSQHAYVITLGTPVVGAQIANLAHDLKTFLHMDDDLLVSLEENNLYLRMLNAFSRDITLKGDEHQCRQVHLYAAYEEKSVGPVPVVPPKDAAKPVQGLVAAPALGFPVNHIQIAKPAGVDDPIYTWVMGNINREFTRLGEWDRQWGPATDPYYLCRQDKWISSETTGATPVQ